MRTPDRTAATLAYAGLALVDAALAVRGARRTRTLTKPLLMPLLHAATRSAVPSARRRTLSRGTAVAQALSWGGDVALLGTGRRSFLAGVGSFAGAHGAYIAGFSSARDPDAAWTDPAPRAAGTAGMLLAPIMAAAAARADPALRGPIAAYSGILTAMFATSMMLDRSLPPAARGRIVAGTALFLLSDGLLGVQDFLLDRSSPPLEGGVMLTYTAGQWCIADGVRAAVQASAG